MTRTLTLELPDSIYELLIKTAAQSGQTPEEAAAAWLEERVRQAGQDPLLQLAGILEADVTDIAERHDDYLGQNLREDRG